MTTHRLISPTTRLQLLAFLGLDFTTGPGITGCVIVLLSRKKVRIRTHLFIVLWQLHDMSV